MPAELIPFSRDPRLRMTRPLRRNFWPEAYRELPSTLYLFCCYLACRQYWLEKPGNDAMATRHSCAPYAFCPDGRPYADYQSPFMPNLTSFAVPDWYIDIYGRATLSTDVFVDVFRFERGQPCLRSSECDPELALIAQALEFFDAASEDPDNRNKKRRVKAAHLQFFEACKIYEDVKKTDTRRRRYPIVRGMFPGHDSEVEMLDLTNES